MAGRSEEEVRDWGATHQERLMKEMDSEWAITKAATDVAVVVLSKRKAEAYGTHARTTRAIVVMVPAAKPAAKPVAKPAPEEEAPMHDNHPEEPEALDAALESKITGIADLLERKRRDEGDGPSILEWPHHGPEALAPQRLSG
jgi:hypothetical protein